MVEAAKLYQQAELPVHAAVAYERAKHYPEAVAAWKALQHHPGLAHRPYEHALVHFDYGLAAVRLDAQSREARRALVESQRKLEQVADDFEQVGELERAFDCFQILLKLGKDSSQFENLAEGYVNCIRVLRDDNLKFYVLQYYEDFIKLALERGELHAAATLYQEAAAFAARAGLPYDRHYQQKSALTWVRCADNFVETGVPVQMVENALLAAASQHSAVGDYPSGARVLRAARRARAAGAREETVRGDRATLSRASRHRRSSCRACPTISSSSTRTPTSGSSICVEWEMNGDPLSVAASVIGDLSIRTACAGARSSCC